MNINMYELKNLNLILLVQNQEKYEYELKIYLNTTYR